jgi:transcriptional regulator with XRE-family HTH domain
MVFIGNKSRKDKICQRVRETRIDRFGEGRGAQKEMSRALGIPYTTYRGYEENRTNDEFLRMLAKKFNIPILWLLAVDDFGEQKERTPDSSTIIIDVDKGVLNPGKYIIVKMEDQAMEPIIPKGATLGILPIKYSGKISEGLIALKPARPNDKPTIRRLVVQSRLLMIMAENPHQSHHHTNIRRTDILGRVIWKFTVM